MANTITQIEVDDVVYDIRDEVLSAAVTLLEEAVRQLQNSTPGGSAGTDVKIEDLENSVEFLYTVLDAVVEMLNLHDSDIAGIKQDVEDLREALMNIGGEGEEGGDVNPSGITVLRAQVLVIHEAVTNLSDEVTALVSKVDAFFEEDTRIVATVTYGKAVELMQAGELKDGGIYRLFLPFMPISGQTGVFSELSDPDNNSNYYYLYLRAAGSDRFFEKAEKCMFFKDRELVEGSLAWEVWYDFSNDPAKYNWANADVGRGVIYRLRDNNGNEAPYDWVNITFYEVAVPRAEELPAEMRSASGRYYTFNIRGDDGIISPMYDFRDECQNNVIARTVANGQQRLLKNILINTGGVSIAANAEGNVACTTFDTSIAEFACDNYIQGALLPASIGLGSLNNTVIESSGSIGGNCQNVSVKDCAVFHIGNNSGHVIIDGCRLCDIGTACQGIQMSLKSPEYCVTVGNDVTGFTLRVYSGSPRLCAVQVAPFIQDYEAVITEAEGAEVRISRKSDGTVVKYIEADLIN